MGKRGRREREREREKATSSFLTIRNIAQLNTILKTEKKRERDRRCYRATLQFVELLHFTPHPPTHTIPTLHNKKENSNYL